MIQRIGVLEVRLITIAVCRCRCGYEWESRVEKPKRCPSCKSYKWFNYESPQLQKPWTADEVLLLGKTTDLEVAKLLGRTYRAVRHKREREGIAAFRKKVWL